MIDLLTLFVTLAVVGVILIIHTQLEKKRHKLEKIRRYVDKTRSDLEGFVEERTREVNDLALDLEAYQRSGGEILRKLQDFYSSIEDKASAIDSLETKLKSYRESVSELGDFSHKVQQNLTKIHNDSSFVEKVSKRLKQAQDQVESLEKSLKNIKEDFSHQNREFLEEIETQITHSANERARSLVEQVDSVKVFLKDYDNSILHIDRKKEDLVQDLNIRIDTMIDSSLSLAKSRLEEYEKMLEGSYSQYNNRLRDLNTLYDDKLNSTLEEVSSLGDNILRQATNLIEVKFNENSQQVQERLSQNLEELERKQGYRLDSFFSSLQERVGDLEKIQEDLLSEFQDKISKQVDLNQQRIDIQVQTFSRKMDASQQLLDQRLSLITEITDNEKEYFKQKINEQYEGAQDELKEKISELSNSLQGDMFSLKSRISQESEQVQNSFEGEKESFLQWKNELKSDWQEMASYAEKMEAELKEALSSQSEKGKQIGQELFNQLEDYFRDKGIEIHKKWSLRSQEVETNCQVILDKAQDLVAEYETKVINIDEDLSEKINLLEGNFKDISQAIEDKSHELTTSSEGILGKLLDDFSDSLNIQIKEAREVLEKDALKLEEWINSLEGRLENHLAQSEESFYTIETQTFSRMESLKIDLEKQFDEWQKNFDSTRLEFQGMSDSFQEKSRDAVFLQEQTLASYLVKFEETLNKSLNETKEKLEKESHLFDIWSQSLQERVSQDFELNKESISSLEEEARGKINQVKSNFEKEFNSWHAHLEESQKNVVEKTLNSQKEIGLLEGDLDNKMEQFKVNWQNSGDILLNKLEDLRNQSENYGRELFTGVALEFESKLKDLEEDLGSKFSNIVSQSNELVENLNLTLEDKKENVTLFKREWDSNISLMKEKFEYIQVDLGETYSKILADGRRVGEDLSLKLLQDLNESFKNHETDILERFVESQKASESRIRDLEGLLTGINSQVEDFESKLEGNVKELEEALKSSRYEWQDSLSNHKDEIQREKESLRNDFYKAKNHWQNESALLEKDFANRIRELDSFYKKQVESLQSSISDQNVEILEEAQKGALHVRDSIFSIVENQENEIARHMEQIESYLQNITSLGASVSQEGDLVRQNLEQEVQVLNEQIDSFSVEMHSRIGSIADNLRIDISKDIEMKIEEFDQGIHYRFERLHALEEQMVSLEINLRSSMDDLSQKITGDLSSQEIDLKRNIENYSQEMKDKISLDRESLENFSQEIISLKDSLDSLKEQAYTNVSHQLKIFEDEFFEDIRSRSEKIDSTLVSWQDRLEGSWEEKIQEKLEGIHSIIDSQAKEAEDSYLESLREQVDKVRNQSANYFSQLQDSFVEFESNFNGRFEETLQRVENSQNEIEENQKEIEESQRNFSLKMANQSREDQAKLDNLMNSSRDKIDQQVRVMEEKISGHLKDFSSVMDLKEKGIEEWLSTVKQDMRHWQEGLFTQMKEESQNLNSKNEELSFKLQETSNSFFNFKKDIENVLNDVNQRINYQFEENSQEFEKRMASLRQKLDSLTENIQEDREKLQDSFRNEMASFEVEIEKALDLRKEEVDKELSLLVDQMKEKSLDLFDQFEGQYLSSIQEGMNQQDKLQGNISQLFQDLNQVRSALDDRLQEAKESLEIDFTQKGQEMHDQLDSLKREIKNKLDDSEERMQEFDTTFEDYQSLIKDKLKGSYDALINRVEEDWTSLNNQIQDKSRKVEKTLADKMMQIQAIEEDWEDKVKKNYQKLFAEIQNVRSFHKELEDLEPIGEKIRNLREDFTFSSRDLEDKILAIDKQREDIIQLQKETDQVKSMSGDILGVFEEALKEKDNFITLKSDMDRMSEVSKDVEDRLERVMENYRSLDDIQKKIMHLADLDSKMDERLGEFNSNKESLEGVIDSLKSNKEIADELESKIQSLTSELGKLPEEVQGLRLQFSLLVDNESSVSKTVEMVEKMGDLISSLEERAEKTQNSLKWLGQAETRLDKMTREAQEQIRLLGLLVKDESRLIKKDQIPSESIRNNVMKLARQGWSKDEIARATKLSLGEVELIMELGIMPVEE